MVRDIIVDARIVIVQHRKKRGQEHESYFDNCMLILANKRASFEQVTGGPMNGTQFMVCGRGDPTKKQ